MQRDLPFAKGQPLSSQRGNILTYYFKTGVIKATGTVNGRGEKDGKWVFYRENGMLWEVGYFKAGMKHGLWVRYDTLGQIELEAEYAAGDEVSKQITR